VGLRAGLDTEARGKILSPLPGIESPSRPADNSAMNCIAAQRKKTFIPFNFGLSYYASILYKL
jgi:hypothetical protein